MATTYEELYSDPRFQRPTPPSPLAGAGGGPTYEQLYSDPRFQRPAPTAAPPPAAPVETGNWFTRNVVNPLAYVGGRAVSGALQFGQGFMPGQEITAGAMPFAPQIPISSHATPEQANEFVFGNPNPVAPGPISRYAGSIAEGFTRDPVLAALGPEATFGGALFGQAAQDLGAPPLVQMGAAALGGSVAGAARAGVSVLRQVGAARRIAKDLGSSETRQQAGTVAKSEAESWLTDETNPASMPAQEKAAWKPFDEQLPRSMGAAGPGGPPVPLTETERTLKSILKIGADDPRVSDIAAGAGGGAAKKIFKWLTGEEPLAEIPTPPRISGTTTIPEPSVPGGMRPIEAGLPPAGRVPAVKLKPIEGPAKDTIDPMEWDGVRTLRTWIGQGMQDPILRNLGQQNLDRLYAALTKDLGATAEFLGLKDSFDAANAVSNRLRTLAEEHIGKIAQAPTPEAAYKVATQEAGSGGSRLAVVRSQLPTTADELGAVHIHQAMTDPRVWNRLAPEAKAQLVFNPADRARIDTAMALPRPDDGGSAVRSILGGELGAHIGQATLDGLLGREGGQAVGSVLGALAPPTLHGMGMLARNPGSLRLPLAGALATPSQGGPNQ